MDGWCGAARRFELVPSIVCGWTVLLSMLDMGWEVWSKVRVEMQRKQFWPCYCLGMSAVLEATSDHAPGALLRGTGVACCPLWLLMPASTDTLSNLIEIGHTAHSFSHCASSRDWRLEAIGSGM